MPEAGMQQGSLIKSIRKRGPEVWQFRLAERGPQGKRIYRKRVIGTVCQYSDADFARTAVTGLLTEINSNGLRRAAQAAVLALVFTAETNTTGLTQTRPVSATAAQ
jgi:hypothetical protein